MSGIQQVNSASKQIPIIGWAIALWEFSHKNALILLDSRLAQQKMQDIA